MNDIRGMAAWEIPLVSPFEVTRIWTVIIQQKIVCSTQTYLRDPDIEISESIQVSVSKWRWEERRVDRVLWADAVWSSLWVLKEKKNQVTTCIPWSLGEKRDKVSILKGVVLCAVAKPSDLGTFIELAVGPSRLKQWLSGYRAHFLHPKELERLLFFPEWQVQAVVNPINGQRYRWDTETAEVWQLPLVGGKPSHKCTKKAL